MLYPKIGIRLTIDGRWGGIRESLEAQTMGLAQAAQTLISSLRYPDGYACAGCHQPLYHRRRRGGSQVRGILCHAERDSYPYGNALLVLWHGNL